MWLFIHVDLACRDVRLQVSACFTLSQPSKSLRSSAGHTRSFHVSSRFQQRCRPCQRGGVRLANLRVSDMVACIPRCQSFLQTRVVQVLVFDFGQCISNMDFLCLPVPVASPLSLVCWSTFCVMGSIFVRPLVTRFDILPLSSQSLRLLQSRAS